MQTSRRLQPSSFQELLITIILGLAIGGVATIFIRILHLIEVEQLVLNTDRWPLHVFFIPVVLLFLYLLKKRTLYFPLKVSELTHWKLDSALHWSPFMSVFHFFGTLASHMVGASVGREGTLVLISAGIVRAFKLSWKEWGPVAMACGFSAIIGNPWIGVVFMTELFKTNMKQKLYAIVASLFADLLMQTLKVQHMISPIEISDSAGFFKKLTFVFVLALSCGFLMRMYKASYYFLTEFFKKKSIQVKLLFSLLLMGILLIPEFRKFQSLGILQLENIQSLELGFRIPLLKLLMTLTSVCLGFWGGEFIPLVYTGLHFGKTLALHLDFDQMLGAYLSCYLFFAGATRLKWTSTFLVLALLGWSWIFWILLLVNLTVGFSGEKGLYQAHE